MARSFLGSLALSFLLACGGSGVSGGADPVLQPDTDGGAAPTNDGGSCTSTTCADVTTCGPSSCAAGCCSADGKCLQGNTTDSCGSAGNACVACMAPQNATGSCNAGKCAFACDANSYASGPSTCSPVLAATSIAVAATYSCAITSAGGVRCWGENTFGQLGDGTKNDRLVPVDVPGLTNVTALALGGSGWGGQIGAHTCALTSAGAVYCWGSNKFGELGNGTTTDSLVPVAVTGLSSGVTAIATARESTCAIQNGAMLCSGFATGVNQPSKVPIVIKGLSQDVTHIAAGDLHWCAELTLGGILCWGDNGAGQLGDGTNTSKWNALTGVTGGYPFVSVVAGSVHTCGMTNTDGVLCWGDNQRWQLGNSIQLSNSSVPIGVYGLVSGVQQLSTGGKEACVVLKTGGVECWGGNFYGQIGDGTTFQQYKPTQVMGLGSGVVRVAVGGDGDFQSRGHVCAIKSGGKVTCWGENSHGGLGNGTTNTSGTPVATIGF